MFANSSSELLSCGYWLTLLRLSKIIFSHSF